MRPPKTPSTRILFLARHAPEEPDYACRSYAGDGGYPAYYHRVWKVLAELGYAVATASNCHALFEAPGNVDLVFSLYNRMPINNPEIFVASTCEFLRLRLRRRAAERPGAGGGQMVLQAGGAGDRHSRRGWRDLRRSRGSDGPAAVSRSLFRQEPFRRGVGRDRRLLDPGRLGGRRPRRRAAYGAGHVGAGRGLCPGIRHHGSGARGQTAAGAGDRAAGIQLG